MTDAGRALYLAAGMFWQVGWSLILGFALSGIIQAVVPKDGMRRLLGREGARETALATLYGAASSSCSYAAAALSKTLFKKGAGFIPSLAFLFASTNLVVELGLILYLLMGWQFTAAEWIGGVVLVVLMAVLVKLTYPTHLVAEARVHLDEMSGHDHGDEIAPGNTVLQRLRSPRMPVVAARYFTMDWSMLWKDLFGGFFIAGALAAFVPDGLWQHFFLAGAPPWAQQTANVAIGPIIAVVSFVCSIGNVPLAAVLWGSGISFAGVLSFLYADLIVLPLLDAYRRYYGLKMAVYIGVVFYVTMVAAAAIVSSVFGALHLVPTRTALLTSGMPLFSINYTFWLNLVFGALAIVLWWLNRREARAAPAGNNSGMRGHHD